LISDPFILAVVTKPGAFKSSCAAMGRQLGPDPRRGLMNTCWKTQNGPFFALSRIGFQDARARRRFTHAVLQAESFAQLPWAYQQLIVDAEQQAAQILEATGQLEIRQ
jgi:hypothetical protein